MDRRKFIRDGSLLAFGLHTGRQIIPWGNGTRLLAAIPEAEVENINWASTDQKAAAKASSYIIDPPWGYEPGNVIIEDLQATDSRFNRPKKSVFEVFKDTSLEMWF